jgi:hypothetical protein
MLRTILRNRNGFLYPIIMYIIFAILILSSGAGCASSLPQHKNHTGTYTSSGRYSDRIVYYYVYPDSTTYFVYKKYHNANGYLFLDRYVDYRR